MSKVVLNKILRKFPNEIIDSHSYLGNETVIIKKDSMLKTIEFIKNNRQTAMDFLVDITCVDFPYEENRFMMVYHFYSSSLKHRIRIKAPLSEEDPFIDSLVEIFPSANWLEREVFDMYGVKFNNHPNLIRILMYDGFDGYPLRKDYSITKRQPILDLEDSDD